ncbi:dihydroorotate dehydrogenase electron transfer subunit [Egibacter rhizosphaerae]|uniref:Dihydroorotate dehydrogenase electron transfer subunit n=1 Tax=Egibacter rhizosphaerae TaxID=1670831 RepID=A0A411YJZ9_9ACTN|nr:dihydroorotate dehydrogenase electron transfer subunit [Egibacter rhizosphaerae]QBI21539.1 dihydroorotate dehydrogenase electron transfer subunit [Egibacter rhizosphaerae]
MVSDARGQEPLQSTCEVLAHRHVGAYHLLTIVAPEMAARTAPGQMVSLGVGGSGTLLRRPFSVAGVSRHGPWAGTIDIVLEVVGEGTAWLARRSKHDAVDVVGPLGRAFPVPAQPVTCLLVGGGYGAAPLLFLGERLRQENLRVDVLFGAANADRVYNSIEAKRTATAAMFTTEDGSLGHKGRVTDRLDDVLDRSGAGVVYACGPMGMLAAVTQVARARRVPVQVSVEEDMACTTGVCMTCVIPYRTRDEVRNVRACIEGPVLDGKRVMWDRIRDPSMSDGGPGGET